MKGGSEMESWSVFLFPIFFGEGPVGIAMDYLFGPFGRFGHMQLLQFLLIWQIVSIPLTVLLFWVVGRFQSMFRMADEDYEKLINSKTPGKFAEWIRVRRRTRETRASQG